MDQRGYRVAIVGASGEVGRNMIETLDRYPIPVSSLRLLASKRSAGKVYSFRNSNVVIEELTENSFDDIDLAFFSAGGSVSLKYAPIAVSKGAVVIDNTMPSLPLPK